MITIVSKYFKVLHLGLDHKAQVVGCYWRPDHWPCPWMWLTPCPWNWLIAAKCLDLSWSSVALIVASTQWSAALCLHISSSLHTLCFSSCCDLNQYHKHSSTNHSATVFLSTDNTLCIYVTQVMNLPSQYGFKVVPLSFHNQLTFQSSWLVPALGVLHSAASYMTERHRQYQVIQLRDGNLYHFTNTDDVGSFWFGHFGDFFVWICSVTGTLEFSFCQ